MKTICLMAMAMMVAGCVTPSDIIMHENHYLEKTVYADADAPYIGEWTTGVVTGLLSVCIRADGRVLMCSSVAHFGTSEVCIPGGERVGHDIRGRHDISYQICVQRLLNYRMLWAGIQVRLR